MNNDWEKWKVDLMTELMRPKRGKATFWTVNGEACADLIESVIKTCPNSVRVELNDCAPVVSDVYTQAGMNQAAGNQLTSESAGQQAQQNELNPEGLQKIAQYDVPGYERLRQVLEAAYSQAARGKGRERHANGLPFDQQPMQTIAQQTGVGFITGQAMKKLGESGGLDQEAAIRELLGAIVYTAGAVIFIQQYKRGRASRQSDADLMRDFHDAVTKRPPANKKIP